MLQDLSDTALIISILGVLYKQKFKFKCETCQTIKKSVNGFISHREQCNKSVDEIEAFKVDCQLCHKKILPSSFSSHMKLHMSRERAEDEENNKEEEKLSPRKKRFIL